MKMFSIIVLVELTLKFLLLFCKRYHRNNFYKEKSSSVSNTEYDLGAVHMSQAEIQRKFTWMNCINKEAAKLTGANRNISHYIRAQVRCSDTKLTNFCSQCSRSCSRTKFRSETQFVLTHYEES